MPRCLIALGGNIGSVDETFAAALRRLAADGRIAVLRTSSTYGSRPIGARAGGEFRNAAAEIETDLPPLELLDRLQATETHFGRTRDIRWGPRTLDLDLITYGSEVIDLPRLRVPHPACWYRRFVLDPLVEVAENVVHPEKRATFGELRRRLLPRPLRMGLTGATCDLRSSLAADLEKEFAELEVTSWQHGDPEPALLAWLGPGDDSLAFTSLPIVPRLDASAALPHADSFLREVVRSATG